MINKTDKKIIHLFTLKRNCKNNVFCTCKILKAYDTSNH